MDKKIFESEDRYLKDTLQIVQDKLNKIEQSSNASSSNSLSKL